MFEAKNNWMALVPVFGAPMWKKILRGWIIKTDIPQMTGIVDRRALAPSRPQAVAPKMYRSLGARVTVAVRPEIGSCPRIV